MSLTICRRHDCVHSGVCQACNWERDAGEKENDLMHTRSELIEAEKRIAHLEAQVDNPNLNRSV